MSKVKTIKITIEKEKVHSILLGDTSMLIQMQEPLEPIEVNYCGQSIAEMVKYARAYPDTVITEFGSR